MDERRVFVLADRALGSLVARAPEKAWAMVMPPELKAWGSDEAPTLRQIVAAHAYDDAWVPDMVAGRTMQEVGEKAYSGDLLGDHPVENFTALVDHACAAVQALDDLERTVHCSFGDFAAREYLWQVTSFRALRAYDIGRAIGIVPELSDELVQGLWEELVPVAEQWRAIGVFPPEVPVPPSAPLLDRLLGLTGRAPRAPEEAL